MASNDFSYGYKVASGLSCFGPAWDDLALLCKTLEIARMKGSIWVLQWVDLAEATCRNVGQYVSTTINIWFQDCDWGYRCLGLSGATYDYWGLPFRTTQDAEGPGYFLADEVRTPQEDRYRTRSNKSQESNH